MPYPVALVLAAVLAASDPDRLLAAVPAEAVAVASLADLDDTRRRAAGNAWCKLGQHAQLRPLFTRASELLRQRIGQTLGVTSGANEGEEARLDVADPWAWLGTVHGPVSGFLVLNGDELGGVGLLVQPGEDAGPFEALWSALIELAAEDSRESRERHRDVEVRIQSSRGEADDTHGLFFEVGGTRALIVGEGREFLLALAQGAIDRLVAEDSSLGFAGRSVVPEARRGAPPAPALELFFDVAGLVRFVQADAIRAGKVDLPTPELLERIGIGGMRYAHVAAALGEGERFELSFSLQLPPDSYFQRASELLRPASRDFLDLAPADAVSISLGGIDVAALWQLLRGVMEEFGTTEPSRLDQGVAAFEQLTGLRLEQDLIAQLTGDFATIKVTIPANEIPASEAALLDSRGAELIDRGTATLLAVDDGPAIENAIARVLRALGLSGRVVEEEYGEHTVNRLARGETALHWCCTDEYLVLSQSSTPLRAVLARIGSDDPSSLGADPRYRRAQEEHAGAVALMLGDARGLVQTLLQFDDLVASAMASGLPIKRPSAQVEELLSLFPDPAFVREHISGVVFQAFEVRPESFTWRVGAR